MTAAAGAVVLIPAYRPSAGLVDLVSSLHHADPAASVVIVDDGSGPGFVHTFNTARSLGASVLRHPRNSGKGSALRTGFTYIRDQMPGRVVVCADADGQHAVGDILGVAARVQADERTMVLGVRQFGPNVPLRSRVGNGLTTVLFRMATGVPLRDTQTGLRAYPPELLDWVLSVEGTRYEYELNLLLRAAAGGVRIDTVPISTIYLDGNASSHFRPVVDSARIYWPLVKFTASSLLAFVVDTVALLVLNALTGSLVAAVIGARMLSATTNYLINRRLVFENGTRLRMAMTATRYVALAAMLLLANYALLSLFTALGLSLLVAKVITEVTLFGASYTIQRRSVFGGTPRARAAERVAGDRPATRGVVHL